jgi:hypothetical protein
MMENDMSMMVMIDGWNEMPIVCRDYDVTIFTVEYLEGR